MRFERITQSPSGVSTRGTPSISVTKQGLRYNRQAMQMDSAPTAGDRCAVLIDREEGAIALCAAGDLEGWKVGNQDGAGVVQCWRVTEGVVPHGKYAPESAAYRNETGQELDGEIIHEFPTPRVLPMPGAQVSLFGAV